MVPGDLYAIIAPADLLKQGVLITKSLCYFYGHSIYKNMIKKFAVVAFLAFVAVSIISCSKGNPKNTDLVGDKNKKLIVGKWRKMADTTTHYVDDKLTNVDKLGITDDYDVYDADGGYENYTNATLNYKITYKATKDSVIYYTPAYNSGGVTISAGVTPFYIRTLTATDLVLFTDYTAFTSGASVTSQKSRTVQVIYYKKQ